MKAILLSLSLLLCGSVYANNTPITAMEVNEIFDIDYKEDITTLADLVDKQEKVDVCIQTYVEKQAKTYAKTVQENLYDLMHNFGKIATKIRGKKPEQDSISFEKKISALARVHCETYYKIGILK